MYVLGVDEAGRGPLAGPLAVCALRAPADADLLGVFPGLNDSKKLSAKKREELFALVEARSEIVYAVEWIPSAQIDAEGLTAPIKQAVASAVTSLMRPEEGSVYLDGLLHAPTEYVQETIPGGDAQVPAIMLASIVAKVLRDRMMVELESTYPAYGFAAHKGYGTKAHYEALRTHGPSPEHRQLFLRKFFGK